MSTATTTTTIHPLPAQEQLLIKKKLVSTTPTSAVVDSSDDKSSSSPPPPPQSSVFSQLASLIESNKNFMEMKEVHTVMTEKERSICDRYENDPSKRWGKTTPTEVATGVLGGLAFWEILIVRLLMPRIAAWAASKNFFARIANQSGSFSKRATDDFTHLASIGLHHTIAGLVLIYANERNSKTAHRWATLLETSFEMSDVARMLLQLWPYKPGQVEFTMRLAMFAHHMPGLVTMIPMLLKGDYGNYALRSLGSWLLFAGGSSALCGAFVHTRDLEVPAQAKQAAFVHQLGAMIFIYARFYLFPKEAVPMIEEYLPLRYGSNGLVQNTGRFVCSALMLFNVLVLKKNFVKTLKYMAKAVTNDPSINFNDLATS